MMTSWNGNIFRVTGHLCGECTGPGDFPAQRPVTRSLDVFFDMRLNKRLSKQSWGWWFETPSLPFWRYRNVDVETWLPKRPTHCPVCLVLAFGEYFRTSVYGGWHFYKLYNVTVRLGSFHHYRFVVLFTRPLYPYPSGLFHHVHSFGDILLLAWYIVVSLQEDHRHYLHTHVCVTRVSNSTSAAMFPYTSH